MPPNIKGMFYKMNTKKNYLIDPEQSLHQLAIFKIIFMLGTISSFVFFCVQWSHLTNSKDLNDLVFNILKVPLSAVAVTISLLAIVAAIHRSAQTAKQIEISTYQNNISCYYRHLDEFKLFVENSDLLHGAYKKNAIKHIHDELWPDYLKSNYNINRKHLEEFEDYTEYITKLIIDAEYSKKDIELWMLYLDRLIKIFNLKAIEREFDTEFGTKIDRMIKMTKGIFHIILELYSFEMGSEYPPEHENAQRLVEHGPFLTSENISSWLKKELPIKYIR